jgi:DNA-directed RNA polymerase subunit RPC12/RpoP
MVEKYSRQTESEERLRKRIFLIKDSQSRGTGLTHDDIDKMFMEEDRQKALAQQKQIKKIHRRKVIRETVTDLEAENIRLKAYEDLAEVLKRQEQEKQAVAELEKKRCLLETMSKNDLNVLWDLREEMKIIDDFIKEAEKGADLTKLPLLRNYRKIQETLQQQNKDYDNLFEQYKKLAQAYKQQEDYYKNRENIFEFGFKRFKEGYETFKATEKRNTELWKEISELRNENAQLREEAKPDWRKVLEKNEPMFVCIKCGSLVSTTAKTRPSSCPICGYAQFVELNTGLENAKD